MPLRYYPLYRKRHPSRTAPTHFCNRYNHFVQSSLDRIESLSVSKRCQFSGHGHNINPTSDATSRGLVTSSIPPTSHTHTGVSFVVLCRITQFKQSETHKGDSLINKLYHHIPTAKIFKRRSATVQFLSEKKKKKMQ